MAMKCEHCGGLITLTGGCISCGKQTMTENAIAQAFEDYAICDCCGEQYKIEDTEGRQASIPNTLGWCFRCYETMKSFVRQIIWTEPKKRE